MLLARQIINVPSRVFINYIVYLHSMHTTVRGFGIKDLKLKGIDFGQSQNHYYYMIM